MFLCRRSTKRLSSDQVDELCRKGDLSGIADALVDDDPKVRVRAVVHLGHAALATRDPRLADVTGAAESSGILRAVGVGNGRSADPDKLARAKTMFSEPLTEMLVTGAEQPTWLGMRQHAAEAARGFCDERAVEPLIAYLQDTSVSPLAAERLIAAEALGALGDPRAVDPLAAEIVRPSNAGSRLPQAAAEALAELGDAGVDGLLRCLAAPDVVGTAQAVKALRQIGTGRGAVQLREVLENPTTHPFVRNEATLALRKLGERVTQEPQLHLIAERVAGGRLLDVPVLGHVVIGHDAFVSMRDREVSFDR